MHTRLEGLVFDLTERGKNAGVTCGNGCDHSAKDDEKSEKTIANQESMN